VLQASTTANTSNLSFRSLSVTDFGDMQDAVELVATSEISDFQESAIEYIAGYICKKLHSLVKCSQCAAALIDDCSTGFVDFKSHGFLKKPSADCQKVCHETEKIINAMLSISGGKLSKESNLLEKVSSAVLEVCSDKHVFLCLLRHQFDCPADENHIHQLIKSVSACYAKIKFSHLGRKATKNATGKKTRRKRHTEKDSSCADETGPFSPSVAIENDLPLTGLHELLIRSWLQG
jgi:hypothetical protein